MPTSPPSCPDNGDHRFADHGLAALRAIRGTAPDPEELLTTAASSLASAAARADDPCELYLRCSERIRVVRTRAEERVRVEVGVEEGTAVRVASDAGEGFVATAGFDPTRVGELIAAAASHPGPPTLDGPPWRAGEPGVVRSDVDDGSPPAPAAARDWLDRAWAAVDGWVGGRRHATVEPVEGWLEVASTVEVLASSDGLRAVRRRHRGRARLTIRGVAPPRGQGAVEVAARDWSALDPDGWVRLLEDRVLGVGDETAVVTPGQLLVFSPESAGRLVQALVMALHVRDGWAGPVGPGWRVSDVPDRAPGFGATFDDAGFETSPLVLADGRRAAGRVAPAGRLRRASYRDRPVVRPWSIRVDPPAVEPPPTALLVSSLRALPLGSGWCLELEAARLERGRPVGILRPVFLPVDPVRLVAGCVGGTGPARDLGSGVRTPALIFEHRG